MSDCKGKGNAVAQTNSFGELKSAPPASDSASCQCDGCKDRAKAKANGGKAPEAKA